MIVSFVIEVFAFYDYHSFVVRSGYTYAVRYLDDPHMTIAIHVDSYNVVLTIIEHIITVLIQ